MHRIDTLDFSQLRISNRSSSSSVFVLVRHLGRFGSSPKRLSGPIKSYQVPVETRPASATTTVGSSFGASTPGLRATGKPFCNGQTNQVVFSYADGKAKLLAIPNDNNLKSFVVVVLEPKACATFWFARSFLPKKVKEHRMMNKCLYLYQIAPKGMFRPCGSQFSLICVGRHPHTALSGRLQSPPKSSVRCFPETPS